MFEEIIANFEQLTFGALFVAMLVYTIKTNDKREQRYIETIQENQDTVKNAVKALRGYDEVKATTEEILRKVTKGA